jgi:CRP-like cAMP-binding protein
MPGLPPSELPSAKNNPTLEILDEGTKAVTTIFSISDILSGRDGESLLDGFRKKLYPKGRFVCGMTSNENGIFIVFVGKLRVYLIGEEREMTLFYLVPGDIFCMHSGCLVEAVEKSEIHLADMATVQKKLMDIPGLGYKMFGVLGAAMLSGLRNIESMAFHDVRRRISLFFLEQAGPGGRVEINGDLLHATLTIDDIAHLIGSARQTTSTALNTLIKDGLVKRASRGKYIILDAARLRLLADGGPGGPVAADAAVVARKRA